MRQLLLVLLLLLSGAAAMPARATAADDAARAAQAQAPLKLTKHALSRMSERGISMGDVERVYRSGESFRYYHQGKWKTGYYEADSRIFLGTDGAVVITVIAGASPKYIANLKKKKP